MNLSKTQITNYISIAGLIVLVANQFGWVLEQNQVAFILASTCILISRLYNFYKRFKEGDLSIGGFRKGEFRR